MKKNLLSLSMLAIALITSSCSNDIDDGQTLAAGSSGQAITFKPWANKQLRSATQAEDVTDFAVLATDTTQSTGGVLIDGALVKGSNASGWTYSPPAFWPETATVNFFAYSPTAAPGVTGGAGALVGQNDKITGQPTIEYELSAQLANQRDLLVARRSSSFVQDGTGGVLLNFRHALSRVLFEAKSESGMQFIVSSIKLKNVKSKAKLDLNAVPKDTDPFPYPTDNATIASVGYQVHWEPDVASTVVDLEANLTDTVVAGDGNWHYVVADDDALYVIPQKNLASNLTKATPVGIGDPDPSNLFYIEITYREDGAGAVDKTYAVPVPAIVGDAYASSIAFEMERQYTFQFELFGKKPIEFKSVTVSPYNKVTPQEELLRLHWAGSNIYWDGTKLTFADSDDKSKEQYQGVFFRWGSLVGLSPTEGAWSGITYYPTNPGVDDGWTTDNTKYATYANIPYAVGSAAPYNRDHAYLTDITNNATTGADTIAALKGDICVYLTKVGAAPKGKRWRMPTSKEFDATEEFYTKSGGFAVITNQNAYGTTPIPGGWRRNNLNTPYFPASGRTKSEGAVLSEVGMMGVYWPSSAADANQGYDFYFISTAVHTEWVGNGNRTQGFSVRCVAE